MSLVQMVEQENILHEMAVGIAESYGKKWDTLSAASQLGYTNLARKNLQVISDTFNRCGWLFAVPKINRSLAIDVSVKVPVNVNGQITGLGPEVVQKIYETAIRTINERQTPHAGPDADEQEQLSHVA